MSEAKGRIAARFAELAAAGRKALIPYIVAGDPVPGATVSLMHTLVEAGADIIELGVPFSDPMAEGPVIQKAHERALERGVSLRMALQMVGEFRHRDKDTPLLLMGYANPLEAMGYGHFCDAAAGAGLDAVLTVDMPPEEVEKLNVYLKDRQLDNIFLVAPTTPQQRMEKIAEVATGFVYYVSFKGVTGAAHLQVDEVAQRLKLIRAHCDLPLAVGFGIKDANSAAAIAAVADGVVVGSALVQLLADTAATGADEATILAAASVFVRSLRDGVDRRPGMIAE